eukprot:CAMPEP_0118655074 /NCGR_PEP_ID=MMETSP0785-20121206/12727_1 /TAXON_ID=91992 /ORGANISM="Bolidomonas pacifica, Strain CCMP 1866" /LENGTH=102 /DNA_ID=CAMNT_0006547773 /DNA_START=87 /DNA_END=395 /DNA_ORIENTATION=+
MPSSNLWGFKSALRANLLKWVATTLPPEDSMALMAFWETILTSKFKGYLQEYVALRPSLTLSLATSLTPCLIDDTTLASTRSFIVITPPSPVPSGLSLPIVT